MIRNKCLHVDYISPGVAGLHVKRWKRILLAGLVQLQEKNVTTIRRFYDGTAISKNVEGPQQYTRTHVLRLL